MCEVCNHVTLHQSGAIDQPTYEGESILFIVNHEYPRYIKCKAKRCLVCGTIWELSQESYREPMYEYKIRENWVKIKSGVEWK